MDFSRYTEFSYKINVQSPFYWYSYCEIFSSELLLQELDLETRISHFVRNIMQLFSLKMLLKGSV